MDCETLLAEWYPMSFCKPCFGKRVSQGQKRGAKRPKPKFEGLDIDAIHRNPRWMKKKETV